MSVVVPPRRRRHDAPKMGVAQGRRVGLAGITHLNVMRRARSTSTVVGTAREPPTHAGKSP